MSYIEYIFFESFEVYKKHHPPMLNDEVWRLEKIGKDGAFHKKLSREGINTVQDFLKLSVVDAQRLRKVHIFITRFLVLMENQDKLENGL